MKVIITESQYKKLLNEDELRFRRVYKDIQNYFWNKISDYIPCGYNYEGGEHDFFADIKGITVENFLYKLYGIQWGDGDNESFFDLNDKLSDMLFETEFAEVKNYYDSWIKEHCPDSKID